MNKICVGCSKEFEGNRKAIYCQICNGSKETKPKEAVLDPNTEKTPKPTKKKEKGTDKPKAKPQEQKIDHSNFRQQLMKSKCGL